MSAAYYALFHAIGWAMAAQLLPDGSERKHARLTRSLDHDALRKVCGWVAKGDTPPQVIADLVDAGRTEVAVVDLADAFLELREKRHAADYDHLADFSKEGVLNLVDSARTAIDRLQELQSADSPALARFLVAASLKTAIR